MGSAFARPWSLRFVVSSVSAFLKFPEFVRCYRSAICSVAVCSVAVCSVAVCCLRLRLRVRLRVLGNSVTTVSFRALSALPSEVMPVRKNFCPAKAIRTITKIVNHGKRVKASLISRFFRPVISIVRTLSQPSIPPPVSPSIPRFLPSPRLLPKCYTPGSVTSICRHVPQRVRHTSQTDRSCPP